jgi:hypothetical protein
MLRWVSLSLSRIKLTAFFLDLYVDLSADHHHDLKESDGDLPLTFHSQQIMTTVFLFANNLVTPPQSYRM